MQFNILSKEGENILSEKKLLSPKIDVVFQVLFGEIGSERITKRFLESILEQKIDSIDLSKNQILRREKVLDKLGILDVIATINGKEKCNIEMQLESETTIKERILYYWSRVYSRQIKKGNKYENLQKTIVILIADFKVEGLEELEYITKWKIIEEKNRKLILTDKLELVIIELPKIIEDEARSELIDWLSFLENPKSERVKEKMKENEELNEAVNKLEEMSEDEYLERIADLREKKILDENSRLSESYNKGLKDGKKETAKKMLQEGIDIETIIKITGLSKEEFKNQ